MMEFDLKALADAPLADPLKLYLPMGRRPGARAPRPVYEGEFAPEALSASQIRQRRQDAAFAKQAAVLDYYATTTVPFERIAEHVGLNVAVVRKAMAERGRIA